MADNDLISRAAVKKEIDKLEKEEHSISPSWFLGIDDCRDIIDCIPAVDAVPVVHARWIQYEPDLHGTKPLECGACHYLFARLYPRDFCPHCGARMDGGENDA